jgi:hypothetical protein
MILQALSFLVSGSLALAQPAPVIPSSAPPTGPTAPAAASPAVPPAATNALPTGPQTETHFLTKYPHLADNVYQEPDSHFYLGLSAGVLGLVANRMFFSGNFFQVHYITPHWDNELLSVAYGTTTTQPSYIQSDHFVLRTVPKYRWSEMLSFGVLAGYEYISFPDISAVLYKNSLQTLPEPFSTSGLIYGLAATQNIKLESGTKFRVTEVAYEETYSTKDAGRGWSYLYANQALRTDSTPLAAGLVVSIEIGFIY